MRTLLEARRSLVLAALLLSGCSLDAKGGQGEGARGSGGVQAVNYDYQESFISGVDVVAAKHPDQLDEVLGTLKQFHGMLRINGRLPAAHKVTLSVRDEMLGLTLNRRASIPAEYTNEEINTRLQERIAAPEAAFFDSAEREALERVALEA